MKHPLLEMYNSFNTILNRYAGGNISRAEAECAFLELEEWTRNNKIAIPPSTSQMLDILTPEAQEDDFFLHRSPELSFSPPAPEPVKTPVRDMERPRNDRRSNSRDADDETALMREWAAMSEGSNLPDTHGGAMAAEWEAMLGNSSMDDTIDEIIRDSTRVLNQDEIDFLLGFDD